MSDFFKKYWLILLLTAFIPSLYAQMSDDKELVVDSILLEKQIPSLNEFIESALKNSPLLQASDKHLSQIFEEIRLHKKSWSDFIFFEANGRYGLYNQLTVSGDSSTDLEQLGIQSNKEQLNYYAGITIKLPLSKFMGQKNESKILSDKYDQRKFEKAQIEIELTQLVIDEYYRLVHLNKSLQLYEDMLQALKLSLLKANKDISSGIISLSDYNNRLVEKVKVEEVYYKIQSEYFAQFYKTQVLTGLNIIETK